MSRRFAESARGSPTKLIKWGSTSQSKTNTDSREIPLQRQIPRAKSLLIIPVMEDLRPINEGSPLLFQVRYFKRFHTSFIFSEYNSIILNIFDRTPSAQFLQPFVKQPFVIRVHRQRSIQYTLDRRNCFRSFEHAP